MTNYYDVFDVCKLMGVGRTTAYRLMKKLNAELEEKGYITIAGRISKQYFHERTYGNLEAEE